MFSSSRAIAVLSTLMLVACGSTSTSPPAGSDAGPDAPVAYDAGRDTANGPDAGPAASEAGASGATAYFIKQTGGTTTASLRSGTLAVTSTYGSSGNAFKYVAPNYYGTSSNGFVSLLAPMTGDFSISARVTLTTQNKANNACGIGVGMTTGFAPTDTYAYLLMRNSNNSTSGYYVSGAGALSAGAPSVAFDANTAIALSFARTGKSVTLTAGPVGGDPVTTTLPTSSLSDGTTVYGDGAVYPALSWNNVNATVTALVIKDGGGKVVFDTSNGTLVNYVPAALALSATSVSMNEGDSVSVTATANAVGGTAAAVTATSADPGIATVSVRPGDAGASTLVITGLAGGATTVTVVNGGDANAATNTKTVLVAVNAYPASDSYGTLPAYPAPGATAAFPDGEFTLTFDTPPTLNPGGSIKILNPSDGSEVDSIAFADETQSYGTTVVKVGSQLARVDGNTLVFTPHLGKLGYGASYYVAIPTLSISGTLHGVAFAGLANDRGVATWHFTTKAAPALDFSNVTVDGAQSSSANFRSLATALAAIASNAAAPANVTINVAAGTYRELLRYTGPAGTPAQTITILGPAGNKQGDTCVFQFANGNNVNGSTQTRPTFYFTGANLVLQNLTFKNTATRAQVAQGETLYFASGTGYTLAATNSSFIGNQDTIQTSGRNWFYKCYFEGNVDFLWGTAQAALFEACTMHFVNDLGGPASYSLLVARTGSTVTGDGTVGKGYVVQGSSVVVDADVTASFGRNAGGGAWYDQAALIDVAFSGAGTLAAGLWNMATAPASLGDSTYVGWKSAGSSGLNLASLTTASGTAASIANQATEYDTRDHILNRVVTIKAGVPVGYEAAPTAWDVSALASAWGAP